MSLLDRGRDTITLFPEKDGTDELGNARRVPDFDAGVTVTGRVQPMTSSEPASEGQVLLTQYRFITRDFPAGAYAVAEYPVGSGRRWDVIGQPARRNGSERTRHATVTLQAHTPEAVSS